MWDIHISCDNRMLCFSDEDLQPVVTGASSTNQAVAASNCELEEKESVFSKLEKTRTILETSLGLASLLEAYQLIQVS